METETSYATQLSRAQRAFQAGQWPEVDACCEKLLDQWPDSAEVWHLRGLVRSQTGNLSAAKDDFERAVALAPNQPALLCNLGEACRRLNSLDQAVVWFQQALRHGPGMAAVHYNLANTLRAQGKTAAAIEHYRQAVTLEPKHARAHYNLGNALLDWGQLHGAVAAYQEAIRHDPRLSPAYMNLGTALSRLDRQAEALNHFRQAVALSPQDPEARVNLAQALAAGGLFDEAAEHYRQAVRLAPERAGFRAGLADVLRERGDLDAAAAAYGEALRLEPAMVAAHHGLGLVLREQHRFELAVDHFQQASLLQADDQAVLRNWALTLETSGQMDEAERVYHRALQLAPHDELLRLHADTLCPLFPADNAAIDAYRARVDEVLDRYRDRGLRIALREVSVASCYAPFALPYQGRDERPLKAKWAAVFEKSFPDFAPRRGSGQPHVAFVVTAGHESIFIRSMRGILERWPTGRWRTTIVCSGRAGEQQLRSAIRHAAIEYLPLPARFDQTVDCLRQARFDVLYYWEVATDVVNYFLPFCRLAPVQCTGWGWQVTTGIPRMDYYLSSQHLEPADGQSHYTERLVLLDSLPTCYARSRAPQPLLPRETWGLRADQHIYFCAQNLLKVHPDFDSVVAEILRRDPAGVAVFTSGRHHYRGELLKQRWAATIPDVLDRVRILPGLVEREYLSLMAAADVSLDTLHYGGVNTTYDALSLGTPVVTLPGRFQRGRYTYAAYRHLDILDCVADSVEGYVDLALRLASEPDRRDELRQRIAAASDVLFDNPAPARELSDCFEHLLAAANH